MLHDMLSRIAREYIFERAKPFANSKFGEFVRHDLPIEANKRLIFLPYELKVKASVGAGVWAAVPWLAFFDPLITESATNGFYVVYLINAQTEEVFLSMNQGATAVYKEFGERRGQEVLRRRATDIRERVSSFAKQFDQESIDLSSEASLPKGYMAGHAYGRVYQKGAINEEDFYSDLEVMLASYAALVDRGGTTPTDVMMDEAGSTDVEETRRYILSRRIERAPNVRRSVLEKRGTVCEACGLDPERHFNFSGPVAKAPLDVHHKKPIHYLAEGETRRYKVPDDFMVLCPTCHRVIHNQSDPSDIETLRQSISFVYAEKLPKLT